MSMIEIISD